MALACKSFNNLNHQLRFLLFEIGIGLTEYEMDHYIARAHRQVLKRVTYAATLEKLTDKNIISHHIDDYLALLQREVQKITSLYSINRWHSLRHEIDETISNQALALAYREYWQHNLKQDAKKYSSLWSWLCEQQDSSSALAFLEQWGCIGHPYHPNFRAKIGFNRSEVIQYSPEFNTQVSIHWLAIHQAITHTSIAGIDYRHLLIHHFPLEYQLWHQKLCFKRLNPDHYYPLPLHPWQWRTKQHSLYAKLLDEKQLILMPHHQKTMPTMSFRTMIPSKNNHSPHLKLAVGVQSTSALRTVSPASVDNGPVVSSWICHLLAKHQNYNERLFLARDLAGINVDHTSIAQQDKKHLALIVRENPAQLLKSNQKLVPLAALFAQSPLSQKHLLIEIIENRNNNPIHFFQKYCDIVLQGQLHLLLRYGVALEAHQQNTLIIFENDEPTGLIIRDLGGIKICLHPLYEQVPKPVFHPDSSISCDSLEALANKFIHGNLQSNLTYWITCLSSNYKLSAKTLWKEVHHVLQGLLKSLKAEINPQIYQWHYEQLFYRPWQHKNLFTMRLSLDRNNDSFTTIPNPLSDFHD